LRMAGLARGRRGEGIRKRKEKGREKRFRLEKKESRRIAPNFQQIRVEKKGEERGVSPTLPKAE